MVSSLGLSRGGEHVVAGSSRAVLVLLAIGMAAIATAADAPWPTYTAFIVGGFAAGMVARSAAALAVPFAAAGMAMLVWSVADGSQNPFNVSPVVMVLIGVLVGGAVGVPSSLMGAWIGRKLWGKPHRPRAAR